MVASEFMPESLFSWMLLLVEVWMFSGPVVAPWRDFGLLMLIRRVENGRDDCQIENKKTFIDITVLKFYSFRINKKIVALKY